MNPDQSEGRRNPGTEPPVLLSFAYSKDRIPDFRQAWLLYCPLNLLVQTEERIAVRRQQESVGSYSQPPSTYTNHEVKETFRIAAGEQYGKPGYHHANDGCNP